MARHGGRPLYRASEADHQAWQSALRPRPCLLALHRKLRTIVASKLILDWSPEQISGWLKIRYPSNESMRVSHETIYLLAYSSRHEGVLKKYAGAAPATVQAVYPPLSARSGWRKVPRVQIVDAISIRERPAQIEDRAIPGHWEGRSARRHQQQSHRNPGGTGIRVLPSWSKCPAKTRRPSSPHSKAGKFVNCPRPCDAP